MSAGPEGTILSLAPWSGEESAMPVREGPAQPAPPPAAPQPYPAEKARGGEIILRTRGRRIVFIAGLAGAVLLALALLMFAFAS
jgi:hypothetical protein